MEGENDQKEVANLFIEKSLSKELHSQLKDLQIDAKELQKEYKALINIGKKLQKIIKKKENQNIQEISTLQNLQANLRTRSVGSIQSSASSLKNQEISERNLSRKEAEVLREMLTQLRLTYQHGQNVINKDKLLYENIKQIYQKDLDDYQLEDQDLKKT